MFCGIEEVAEEATSLVATGMSYLSLVASVANELQFYPVKEGFEGPQPGFVFKMGELQRRFRNGDERYGAQNVNIVTYYCQYSMEEVQRKLNLVHLVEATVSEY